MKNFSNMFLGQEDIGMANYHLEVSIISRRKGRSVVKSVNYISGRKLHDSYNNRTYYNQRTDLLQCKIFLPDKAPPEFYDLQRLCDEIDKAETRYDARTAREFKEQYQMNYHYQKKNKMLKNLSITTLLLTAYAQLPPSMKVETKQIQNGIILMFTSLCRPELLIKTALVQKKIGRGTKRNILTFGVQTGQMCRI